MRNLKKISTKRYILLLSSILVTIFLIMAVTPSSGDITRPKAKTEAEGNKFMGAGSCASSNCHGAAQARNVEGIDINQNEYSIWFAKDKHRNAYNVLLEPGSIRIAKNLRLPDTPGESEKCLVCHTTYAPAALWSGDFDFSDGVSCESCHGPAEKWIGPHTQKDWNETKAAELGMFDTENLYSRAEQCLSCHIGDETKTVDHEMIAAGHPDLNRFEFDTFLALMPPHWRKNQDNTWEETEIWAIGQVTALKQSMDQLERRANNQSSNPWPEFAEYNCYGCHHDLEVDSWRQTAGYQGRTPGYPVWNSARYILVKPIADRISPDLSSNLTRDVASLTRLLDRLGLGTQSQISMTATEISSGVADIEMGLKDLKFDENLTYDLLINISGDGDNIAKAGIRSAQQSAVALETLFFNYSQNIHGPYGGQINTAINELFNYLEHPESYRPSQFLSQMNSINQLLKRNR